MARIGTDSGSAGTGNSQEALTFQANGQDRIELPSSDFIADAKMTRDGDNLVLQAPNGETVVIEGYFNAEPAPLLQSADGATLTPNLVEAFVRSPMEFAANDTVSDESPVGAVEEVKGTATVTRADGTVETITIGTPIYQGDVIETDASGAVNIVFMDETSMAISENARLAIDEYKYDPATESGTTNFSVLRGLFVFTSGLIGRDDPDDVSIDTPVGSIGIRGTVIAGEINPSGESKITVLEGAIVVKNGAMETVLSEQFQTVTLDGFDAPMRDIGVVPANDINTRFHSIGDVNPGLFSMIGDTVREQSVQQPTTQEMQAPVADQPSSNDSSSPQPQSQNDGAAQASDTTAAAPAPEAPAPAPLVADIVTLSGDTSALPSIDTATGQPSGGLAGSSTTAPSTSTAASTGTTGAAAPVSASPAGSSSNASSTTTTTPDTSVVDPTQQLAPPSVTNPGNTTPTPPTTPTVPPAFTSVSVTGGTFNDVTMTGTVVGNIGAVMASGFTVTSYAMVGGTNPYFDIDANGVITLSADGRTALAQHLDVFQLGNFTVRVTASNGEFVDRTFTSNVTDANGATSVNLNAPPTNIGTINDNIDNNIGYSITALGDINNDGFDDFAFSNNAAGQNHSYIVYGYNGFLPNGSNTLPPNPTRMVTPGNFTYTNDTTETVITGIGDFNGDGIMDYAVGQGNNTYNGVLTTGAVGIYSGNVATTDHRMYTSTLPMNGQFGSSLVGVGDFNNDGYADVAVGAPGNDAVYLIGGSATPWGTSITSAQNVTGSTIGHTANNTLGSELIALGDMNGDGYSDFATNMPGYGTGQGGIMIFHGNAGGSIVSGNRTPIVGGTGQGLGQEIASLGDINGDGYSDFIATDAAGIGYIYNGRENGYTTNLFTVNLNSVSGFEVTGGGGIGDFNGDGYGDFSISVSDGSSILYNYVVFGGEQFDITGTPTPFMINAQYLKNPLNAMEFRTTNFGSHGDTIINGLGDINGDGYDDFAMSVQDIDGTANAGNGGMYIMYGRNTGGVTSGPNPVATANDANLVGNTGNNVLDDGGFTGVSMRGGAGMDVFEISNTDFLKIDGGSNVNSGGDTILTTQSLNFSDINFEKITGIEKISFGSSGQTMTLTTENLFNLLKSSDDGILKIDSGTGTGLTLILQDPTAGDNYGDSDDDPVDIIAMLASNSSGTPVHSTANENGENYDVFQIGGYRLLINTEITVDAQ